MIHEFVAPRIRRFHHAMTHGRGRNVISVSALALTDDKRPDIVVDERHALQYHGCSVKVEMNTSSILVIVRFLLVGLLNDE